MNDYGLLYNPQPETGVSLNVEKAIKNRLLEIRCKWIPAIFNSA